MMMMIIIINNNNNDNKNNNNKKEWKDFTIYEIQNIIKNHIIGNHQALTIYKISGLNIIFSSWQINL